MFFIKVIGGIAIAFFLIFLAPWSSPRPPVELAGWGVVAVFYALIALWNDLKALVHRLRNRPKERKLAAAVHAYLQRNPDVAEVAEVTAHVDAQYDYFRVFASIKAKTGDATHTGMVLGPKLEEELRDEFCIHFVSVRAA
jgi:hypothetical protein